MVSSGVNDHGWNFGPNAASYTLEPALPARLRPSTPDPPRDTSLAGLLTLLARYAFMKIRILALINVLLLAVVTTLSLGTAVAQASPLGGADENTEDILYMKDGRELHGQILEEKTDAVVFELAIRGSSIRTRLTYLLEEIAEIHRDIPMEDAPEGTTARGSKTTRGATSRPGDDDDEEDDGPTFGAIRASSDNENLPSFYIVPMKGQMGTDINTEVYRDMVDDIRANDPDIMVIEMECRDTEDVLYSLIGREETGLADFDEYRKLINLFHDELGDIRQVAWVKDSVGVSSIVALGWEELYMSPEARLGGLETLRDQTGFDKWSDDDVRGKMTAAFMSWVKGFLEYGGYSLVLAEALVRPEYSLSGTWKGRDVNWTLDTNGEYIVDQDDEATVEFRAKSAEDLCISDGTVENLDDLALLLGMREYRVLDGRADKIFEDYTTNWRRALDNCVEWMQDYQQFMGWANGQDALKYLGQAKNRVEKVIASMERYSAVETRMNLQYGVKKFDLVTIVEQIKEQIRGLRPRRGGGGGRSGGGPGTGG